MTHETCMHGFPMEECLTCFTPEGECSFGGCTADAELAFEWHGAEHQDALGSSPVVLERRRFCTKHGTHPHFAFARRDAAPFVTVR